MFNARSRLKLSDLENQYLTITQHYLSTMEMITPNKQRFISTNSLQVLDSEISFTLTTISYLHALVSNCIFLHSDKKLYSDDELTQKANKFSGLIYNTIDILLLSINDLRTEHKEKSNIVEFSKHKFFRITKQSPKPLNSEEQDLVIKAARICDKLGGPSNRYAVRLLRLFMENYVAERSTKCASGI